MNTRSLDAHAGSQHVDGHTGLSIGMGPNYRSQYTITPAVAALKMGGGGGSFGTHTFQAFQWYQSSTLQLSLNLRPKP